jgi:hypothetical protein
MNIVIKLCGVALSMDFLLLEKAVITVYTRKGGNPLIIRMEKNLIAKVLTKNKNTDKNHCLKFSSRPGKNWVKITSPLSLSPSLLLLLFASGWFEHGP